MKYNTAKKEWIKRSICCDINDHNDVPKTCTSPSEIDIEKKKKWKKLGKTEDMKSAWHKKNAFVIFCSILSIYCCIFIHTDIVVEKFNDLKNLNVKPIQ